MQISFIATANGGTLSTTSFSITFPGAVQVGDLLILEWCHRGTGNGTLGGDGSTNPWVTKHKQFFGTGSPQDFSGHLRWKIATAADVSSPARVVTCTALIDSCAAILSVYRGTGGLGSPSGEPLNEVAVVGEENASANEVQAGVTTVTRGAWVVLVVVNSPDLAVSSGACTNPGALSERSVVLSTGGTDTSISHWSGVKVDTGATGNFTWSQTNAVSGSWAYAITPTVFFGDGALRERADRTVASGTVSTNTGVGVLRERGDRIAADGTVVSPSGPHDPGAIARLGQIAVGTSKYGSFSGKQQVAGETFGAGVLRERSDYTVSASAVAIVASGRLAEAADAIRAAGTVAIAAAGALREQPDRIAAAGGTALFADGALRESGDRASGAGTVSVSGTGALREAADRLQSAGQVAIVAAGRLVEAADRLLATGTLEVSRTIGRVARLGQFGVGARDYVGFTPKGGAPGEIVGTGRLIEAGDRAAGSGSVLVTGAGVAVERGDRTVAAGSVAVAGVGVLIERADRIVADGTGALTGAGTLRERGDKVTAAGVVLIATVGALRERADRVEAAAVVAITGIVRLVEAADLILAEGGKPATQKGRLGQFAVGLRDYVGFQAKTQTGTEPITGYGVLRERGDRTSGEGVLVASDHNPGHVTRPGQFGVGLQPYAGFTPKSGSITAVGVLRETSDRLVAAATVAVAAAGSVREVSDRVAGAGAVAVAGSGVLRERPDRVDSSGGLATFGEAVLRERADAVSATGVVLVSGVGSLLECGDAVRSAGIGQITGAGYLRESADSVIGLGAVRVAGTGLLIERPDRIDSEGITASIIGYGELRERPDRIEATAVHGFPVHIIGADHRRSGPSGGDHKLGRATGADHRHALVTTGEEP